MGKSIFSASLIYHFYNHNKFRKSKLSIHALYLGYPKIIDEIKLLNIKATNSSIILLDAFDENYDATKDCKHFLKEIEQETRNFGYVIITSRTQIFPTEKDEPELLSTYMPSTTKGDMKYKRIYISPFKRDEAERYLKKKFRGNPEKQEKVEKLMDCCPDLVCRPMIMSFIENLIEIDNPRNKLSSHIYYHIIEKWIERELKIQKYGEDFGISKKDMFVFSKEIALRIYEKWTQKSESYLTLEEYRDFYAAKGYRNSPYSFGKRSLVNRKSDGAIKFSHKSIWEFFIAVVSIESPWKSFKPEGLDTAVSFARELHKDRLSGKKDSFEMISFPNPPNFYIDEHLCDFPAIIEREIANAKYIYSPFVYNLAEKIKRQVNFQEHEASKIENTVFDDIYILWDFSLKRLPYNLKMIRELKSVVDSNYSKKDEIDKLVENIYALSPQFKQCFSSSTWHNFIDNLNSIIDFFDFDNATQYLQIHPNIYQEKIIYPHKESILFPYFNEYDYIFDKTVLANELFIGQGIAKEDSVIDIINKVVKMKKDIETICLLRGEADVDDHVSYINKLASSITYRPPILIFIIQYKDKMIYYTINKSEKIEENQVRDFFYGILNKLFLNDFNGNQRHPKEYFTHKNVK